jgi:hypothetical protein
MKMARLQTHPLTVSNPLIARQAEASIGTPPHLNYLPVILANH